MQIPARVTINCRLSATVPTRVNTDKVLPRVRVAVLPNMYTLKIVQSMHILSNPNLADGT